MKDKEKQNNFVIKFIGKAELPEPLTIDEGYKVFIEGEVVHFGLSNNHDGSYTEVYSFRPIKAEITDKKGKIIKVKDTRSMSQKQRRAILWLWEQNESDPDDAETAYERTMNVQIGDVEFAYKQGLIKKE